MWNKKHYKMIDVLHLASFSGNIGDNANHNGTRRRLRETLDEQVSFESLEIRRHYQNYEGENPLSFDKSFTNRANKKDLLLIGGGSFFDVWIDSSSTGTTIDISKDQINNINTPIVFHGMGCIFSKNESKKNKKKFIDFLSWIVQSKKCLVSVRNDGSYDRIKDVVPEQVMKGVHVIPDGAFFMKNASKKFGYSLAGRNETIGVNIVSDMPRLRFDGDKSYNTYDGFIVRLSNVLEGYLEKEEKRRVILIPHIHSDLKAISDLLQVTAERIRRHQMTVAPYLSGQGDEKKIFGLYKVVDLVIGMRYHSNVCAIGLETPSIGLANGHPKVKDMYESLSMNSRTVNINSKSFNTDISDKILQSHTNSHKIKMRYKQKKGEMSKKLSEYHSKVRSLISV